ncbi:IS21-like element helper ATPase IstB [Alicyclobacillus sp. ALC3]|uniref:IS21-like element helper ATPase IstB n=1 Tax=Alicyclobacillus sp. ALC3 TaxID=2796143 RepID=UPI002379F74B|nr:IS21-like element helper ATPase IstB [Alicyclobacillus sp. ALC3]WDL98483.1 IS21-like element helper ATPase IstB [Alicyclobacillus sp. ALC3]
MLTDPTVHYLRQMKLGAMADAYARQVQDPAIHDLTFEERFGLLVDQEWVSRQNHRQERLIREAKLKVRAAPEEVERHPSRILDHSLLRSLATGQWIQTHHNLIVTGPTGVGKTFVTCALGVAACRQNMSVRYFRVSRLLQDVAVAKGDGSYARLRRQLQKADLLILDDWGLAPMSVPESRDLLDLLDERTMTHSSCIASQLPVELWHQHFADPTLADAILDRIVHNAYRLEIKGESMRKLKSDLPNLEDSGK